MSSKQTNEIILGIDPGTTVMGYGIIEVLDRKRVNMLTMGVIDLKKYQDHYTKLQKIFNRTLSLIDEFRPTCLSIEAPFYGKNVQSMLKLGRAQGVAISAALYRNMPITEYAPLKIKMAITGSGGASKEQVADMLKRFLKIPNEQMLPQLDATDGLAAAYCHFLQISQPKITGGEYKNWKDFVIKNKNRVNKGNL